MKSCCKEIFEQDEPQAADAPKEKNGLQRLQQKWGLPNTLQVILILCTFAIGGSLAGFGGRIILAAAEIENSGLWISLYVILVTLLWPVCVLLIGTVLGQRSFFLRFLNRLSKIRLPKSTQNSR
jgi:hypothetical protein